MSCHNSSLLIIPVLGTPACEWLWCLSVILSCWSWLSLALQEVSACCALLQFQPADHDCPWHSSLWVAVVPCCNPSLLIITVLCSPVCEWLWCLAHNSRLLIMPYCSVCEWLWCFAAILACWSCLSALVCKWLWCLDTILAWSCLSLAFQEVSGCGAFPQC